MAIFGKKKDDPVVARYAPSTPPAAGGVAVTGGTSAVVSSGPAANSSTTVPATTGAGSGTAVTAVEKDEGSRLIVGPNIRLAGSEISDCDTVIVEGRVEATVDGRVMQIAETGMFTGTVAIDMAEIRGKFQGELTVRKRLTVCGTGKVQGKIRYGTLVVEEGGELSGDVDSLEPGTSTGKSTVKDFKTAPATGGKVGNYPPSGMGMPG